MSLLSVVNRFAAEINVDSDVTAVMSTTDPQIIQIKSLLQKEVNDLAGRGDWESLVNEARLTTSVTTGTISGFSGTQVIDTSATWLTSATVGDSITNTSTGASSTVATITNDIILSTTDEIFSAVGQGYNIGGENLGPINEIATNGFRYIRNDTIWDRDLRLPVYVIDATDWQQVKAIAVTGPRYQARIRGGDLLCNPSVADGHTWAFEYVTWNALTDSTGVTQKQYFTSDDDLMLLPEFLLESGLQWRWKKQKGMEYAEDFRTYEHLVANELSRNGIKRPLRLDQSSYAPHPKIYTPDGNWNL